jgi:hypothetical protein
MNRITRPSDITKALFGLLLGVACASAVAGEPHAPLPTSPTLFYACMSTNRNFEYDSAAFEAKNPGANSNGFYQEMSSAFEDYLQQKYGFRGVVQCVQHATLAEEKSFATDVLQKYGYSPLGGGCIDDVMGTGPQARGAEIKSNQRQGNTVIETDWVYTP